MDDHDLSKDLQLALVIGAAAALYAVLPPQLRSAAHIGTLVGVVFGAATALIRRNLAATKPSWLRTALQVPPFAAGAALGFVAMTWLAEHLPRWLSALPF
jgi:hypothetical protein